MDDSELIFTFDLDSDSDSDNESCLDFETVSFGELYLQRKHFFIKLLVYEQGFHNARIVRNFQGFKKNCKMSGKTSGFWDFSPNCQDFQICIP